MVVPFNYTTEIPLAEFLATVRYQLADEASGWCVVHNQALDPSSFMQLIHDELAPSLSISRKGDLRIPYDEVKDRGDRMTKEGDLLSSSNLFFPLHTDCCFLERPADMVALYCVENAATGGETILLPVKQVVDCLSPAVKQQLLTRMFSFYSKAFPILEKEGASYLIRFHEGELLESCTPLQREACIGAIQPLLEVLREPAYHTTLKLAANQCLLLNNRTCLHGRRAFEPASRRTFYRSRHYFTGEWSDEKKKGTR